MVRYAPWLCAMSKSNDQERAALIAKVTDPDYELSAGAQIRTGSIEGQAETLAMLVNAAETAEEQEMIRKVGTANTD